MLDKVSNDIAYLLEKDRKAFERLVWDLFALPEVQSCREVRHHFIYNRLEHMILVSKLAMYIARRLGADERTCARAGILHDLGQFGQGFPWPGKKSRHDTRKARDFAAKIGESVQVQKAIYTHHWHRHWPKTREGYVLVLADICASMIEMGAYTRNLFQRIIPKHLP